MILSDCAHPFQLTHASDPATVLTRPEPSTETFSTFTTESLAVADIIEGDGCPSSTNESDDAASDGAGDGEPDDSTQLLNPDVDMAGDWDALIADWAAEPASERVSCSCSMSILDARLDGGRWTCPRSCLPEFRERDLF